MFNTTPVIVRGGHAEADAAMAGSDHIPNRIVEGFMASAADHLRAWLRMSAPTDDDRRPFLHLYADLTIWRAVLEAVGFAVWVLGPEEPTERIQRATKVALYEWADSGPVERSSGDADDASARMKKELRRIIEKVSALMNWEVKKLEEKRLSPSAVVKSASSQLGREGRDLHYWWKVCSRFAHGQTLTVILRGVRVHVDTPHGGVIDVSTDEQLFVELLEFAIPVFNRLIRLANKRGIGRAPKASVS